MSAEKKAVPSLMKVKHDETIVTERNMIYYFIQ
jgi:hypothetical protein